MWRVAATNGQLPTSHQDRRLNLKKHSVKERQRNRGQKGRRLVWSKYFTHVSDATAKKVLENTAWFLPTQEMPGPKAHKGSAGSLPRSVEVNIVSTLADCSWSKVTLHSQQGDTQTPQLQQCAQHRMCLSVTRETGTETHIGRSLIYSVSFYMSKTAIKVILKLGGIGTCL